MRFALALAFSFLAIASAGCDRKTKHAANNTSSTGLTSAQGDAGGLRCVRDAAFPETIDLPEASAAAEVELTPGVREILVISDGHHGKAFAWRIPSGPARTFHLDLDDTASEDIEGLAWRGGKLFTLTSSGALRIFVPDKSGGLRREGATTRIAPVPLSCADLHEKQCGSNYEGLCLRPASAPETECVGYAASKERNELHCLRFRDGVLAVQEKKGVLPIGVHKHALSDCAFGAAGGPAEGRLLITTNSKGGSETYIVDQATGALRPLDAKGTSSNEAIALDRDGTFYAFADAHQKKSEGLRYLCSGWPTK